MIETYLDCKDHITDSAGDLCTHDIDGNGFCFCDPVYGCSQDCPRHYANPYPAYPAEQQGGSR